MSGYYVGYHGSALVLREDEYDEMIETYQKKIVSRLKEPLREDFQNLVIDQDCLLSEYPFIRSSYLECDPNEILEDEDEANAKVFDIINISADEFDGMLLIPYCNDGKLHLEHDTEISFHGEDVYVIFSDIQLDCPFRDLPCCHPFSVHGYDLLIDIRDIFLAFLYHLWFKGGVTVLWDFDFHASIAAIHLFGFIAIAIVIAIGTF